MRDRYDLISFYKKISVVGVLVLGIWGACGASTTASLEVGKVNLTTKEARPLTVGRSFFIPGEVMKFELSLRGLVGGEAITAVGQPGKIEGRPIVIVKSRVESAGLAAVIKEIRDDVETWIALDIGRPVRHAADSLFGEKHATMETDLGDGKGGSFSMKYQRKGSNEITLFHRLPVGTTVYDIHGALGILRHWDAADGETASLYVIAGRRIWRNTLQMAGRETIRTSMGSFPTRRIDGVALRQKRGLSDDTRKAPREFTVWLSDDENRIPVLVMAKTEYGDVRVELTDYTRPDQRLTWR